MDEVISVILRAILSLVTLFLVTKLIGKKQVSQLSLFDYVIGISIGNFAAELTTNTDSPIMNGTLAVVIFGLIAWLISILTMKSIVLRRFFTGTPTVIIEDGVLLERGLRREKLDVNDFLEQCREQGYFDISQIAYAIMESSGKISILPKSDFSSVTLSDMDLKRKKASLVSNVIIDGNIMINNLKFMGKDKKWVLNKLKENNKRLEDILLGTLDGDYKLVFYEKSDRCAKNVLE